MVVGPAERLDPLSRQEAFLRTLDAGYLPVGDVSDEDVPERILGFPCDPRSAFPLHELLSLEGVEALLEHSPLGSVHRGERSKPEDLADDRRILKEKFLVDREEI